ncbi:hypothetical protein HK103_006285 [Boothiomyces macroporosus]|uniref:Uncharacterized protein n=1 Tax=Boothiomyces macroporosus TaxID=261099 RepID=A0AAD5UDS9_9FUNG|nr:hypothetical protein HK103_006285 [Boothiomyces macroporosus]
MHAFNNNFNVSDASICDENCTREMCKGIRTKLLPKIQIDADGIKSLHLRWWTRYVYCFTFLVFLAIPVVAAIIDIKQYFPVQIATVISLIITFFIAKTAEQSCQYFFKNDHIVDLLKERRVFTSIKLFSKYAGYPEDEIVRLLWAKDGRRGAFIGSNGCAFMDKENGKLELTHGVPIDMLRFRSWYICRSQTNNHVLARVTYEGEIKERGTSLEVYYCNVTNQYPLILHTQWERYRISDEEEWHEVVHGYLV